MGVNIVFSPQPEFTFQEAKLQTPSEQIVDLILPLLLQAELILSEDAKQYASKLSAGSMKAEDWLLAAQKSLDKKKRQAEGLK